MKDGNMKLTKEDEKANREKVWHTGWNQCTEKIMLHPIRSWTYSFRFDGYCKNDLGYHDKKFGVVQSLIHFDTRQVWECYFADFGSKEWDCERGNLVIRLSPPAFERVFGKIQVVSHLEEMRKAGEIVVYDRLED